MNITPRVRVSENNQVKSMNTRIPYHRAIRWQPKDEEMNQQQPPLAIFLTQTA
jgi:hypothetical protein